MQFIRSYSFSDFDGFTYDDILSETSDLNERENNSSDVDFSSDSDDLPLSRLRNGHDNGPNEDIEHTIRNRTTSWSSALTDIRVDVFVQPVGAVNILANDAKEINFLEQIFPNKWYLKIAQETTVKRVLFAGVNFRDIEITANSRFLIFAVDRIKNK